MMEAYENPEVMVLEIVANDVLTSSAIAPDIVNPNDTPSVSLY